MKSYGLKIFLLSLTLFLSAAHALAQAADDITGTWRSKGDGVALVLKLNADQTGSLGDSPFGYAVLGDKLVVREGERVSSYTFKLKDGVLTLFMDDGRGLQFERVGRAAEEKPSAAQKEENEKPAGNPLVGRWVSSEGTAEVRDDGTLVFNGQTLDYSIKGNVINIMTDEGVLSLPFRLSGDTLTVTTDEGDIVYRREKRGAGGGVATGGGANPRELLGKWCYMANVNSYNGGRMSNRCFTLNGDGTYEYYSETSSSGPVASSASQEYDAGTWTATANSITAVSRTNGTTNTYRLEKRNHPKNPRDPMLVLDGDAYVTATQRPPWP